MKKLIVISLVFGVVVFGFLFIHGRTVHVASLGANIGTTNGTLFSDGGHTWNIGAVIINGTNVPLNGIKVRAITNEVSK
jgi:hypothetical protein